MMNRCPLCKGLKEPGKTTFTVDLPDSLLVVREVPAQVCQQCGESWIDDHIAKKLEMIVNEAKKHPKQVEIILFKDAA